MIAEIGLPIKRLGGLNVQSPAHLIDVSELQVCKNAYGRLPGLLSKKPGSAYYNSSPISGSQRIAGLYRYYYSYPSGRIICASNFLAPAADKLYYGTDATGALTEMIGTTVLSNGKRYWFTPYGGNCYICNGTDMVQVTADGLTRTNITAPGGGSYLASMPAFEGCCVYRDQMVWWGYPDAQYKDYIYWSDFFLPHKIGVAQFERFHDRDGDRVTCAVPCAVGTTDIGLRSQLVVFKNYSHYVVDGVLGSVYPVITANYTKTQASRRVGCPAPSTARHTQLGLIFMGHDNVYLFNPQGEPVPMGDKLGSLIWNIPKNIKKYACAEYQKGFYKLSFATSGGSYNTVEYWMDCRYGIQFAQNSWFGPMGGPNIAFYAIGKGEYDEESLWGACGNAGRIYKLDQSVFTDLGTAIEARMQLKNFDEALILAQGEIPQIVTMRNLNKRLTRIDVGLLLAYGATMTFNFYANRAYVTNHQITSSQGATLWDVAKWDVDVWSGEAYEEHGIPLGPRVMGKELSIEMVHSDPTDFDFTDMTLGYQPIERRLDS